MQSPRHTLSNQTKPQERHIRGGEREGAAEPRPHPLLTQDAAPRTLPRHRQQPLRRTTAATATAAAEAAAEAPGADLRAGGAPPAEDSAEGRRRPTAAAANAVAAATSATAASTAASQPESGRGQVRVRDEVPDAPEPLLPADG